MGIIAVGIKNAAPASWVAYFDNTKWTPASSTYWNSTYWDANGLEIYLNELGTWVEGYRPTKVRVTYTGSAPTLTILGTGGVGTYGTAASYVSEAELSLNCTGDIGRLTMSGNVDVTNIEFFGG